MPIRRMQIGIKKGSFYIRKGDGMQTFWGEKWSYMKGTSILKNIIKVIKKNKKFK